LTMFVKITPKRQDVCRDVLPNGNGAVLVREPPRHSLSSAGSE
jgi:hypothetical protein